MLRQVADSGQPLAMSPGEQLIDLVHIDDVAEAFRVAADRLRSGAMAGHERFGVGSGRPLPLRDIAAAFSAAIGRPIPIEWGGRPYRRREVMTPWQGDWVPGWAPRVPLTDGLRRLEGNPDVR